MRDATYLVANPAYTCNDQEEDDQRNKVRCAHLESDVELAPWMVWKATMEAGANNRVEVKKSGYSNVERPARLKGIVGKRIKSCVSEVLPFVELRPRAVIAGRAWLRLTVGAGRSVVRSTRLN